MTVLCNPQSYDCLLFLTSERGREHGCPFFMIALELRAPSPTSFHCFPDHQWPHDSSWIQNTIYTTMFIVVTRTCPNSQKEEQKVQNFCESPCSWQKELVTSITPIRPICPVTHERTITHEKTQRILVEIRPKSAQLLTSGICFDSDDQRRSSNV